MQLKLFEIVESCEAKFLIRKTKNLVLTFDEVKKCKGQCKTGQVEYGSATLSDGRKVFAIIIKRKKPAKDGTKEVILLTNLTIGSRLAVKLADLYLERWKIEEAFRQLTEYLSCEVKTLGYPRAALLAFSLAVTAYNCMRCVKGAMAFRFGTEHVDENLSMYHLGLHLKQTIPGALIALDESDWCMVDQMSPTEVVIKMKEIAGNICFDRFRKDRRSKPRRHANRQGVVSMFMRPQPRSWPTAKRNHENALQNHLQRAETPIPLERQGAVPQRNANALARSLLVIGYVLILPVWSFLCQCWHTFFAI